MQAMPDSRQQTFEEIYGPPENFLEIEVCPSSPLFPPKLSLHVSSPLLSPKSLLPFLSPSPLLVT
jgi:hypothetical protein